MPARLVKGAIADAARRAKSFLKLKKQGRAYTGKHMVRRVTITYSDSQDWRLQGDAILLRTHHGWLEFESYERRSIRDCDTSSSLL